MAKLTISEREEWLRVASLALDEPVLRYEERIVAPTTAARERYARFATEAAKLFKGSKPVHFEGAHWKL
jgi:hypothetical protein